MDYIFNLVENLVVQKKKDMMSGNIHFTNGVRRPGKVRREEKVARP